MSRYVVMGTVEGFGDSVEAELSLVLPEAYCPPGGVQVWDVETGEGIKCAKRVGVKSLLLTFDREYVDRRVRVVVV